MQNIILTGVTRGLGLALLNHYAKKNYNLILISKNSKRLITLKKKFKKKGIDLHIYTVNLCKIQNLKKIVTKILIKFGRIDILINNAGIWGPIGNFEKIIWSKWIEAININLIASAYLMRAVLPSMKKNNFGRIINMSSMNFTGGGRPGVSHYSSAKAAIAGLTQTLAKEVGKLGITVNAIAPGYVSTELIAQFTPEMMQVLTKQNPVGRTCMPEEVAALVTFLCSNQAAFINGELICMDGGRRDFYWGN
jgi:3-oxoacyl-[acyl-carrier protein] reductase